MSNLSAEPFVIFLNFAALILYNLRAFSFCCSILELGQNYRLAKPISILVNCLLLAAVLFLRLPVLLAYLLVYLDILLQFCMSFHGNILVFLFGSGTFLFHLMNVQMIVTSLFVLTLGVTSPQEFLPLFPSALFFTLLLVVALLEVFRRAVNQDTLRLLLQNNGQLFFVTISLMLINIYLLILSISYNGQSYSPLASLFLLCTGVLLFGAFYTSFQHAARMSVLLEYEVKSHILEQQLIQSYQDIGTLEGFAFTDALTEIHNRRFGLEQLSRLLESGEPACVCFLDIDHLKEVNDQFGHEEGDRYILRVVRALSDVLTNTNTLARLGGDEFLLLMPHQSEKSVKALLEGVRRTLSRFTGDYLSSISYGILELKKGGELTASEVLRQADRRMYQYKQAHHGERIRQTDKTP